MFRPMHHFDYVLVGGGLQSGLITLALRARRPQAKVLVIERGASLGGNHTWCFHGSDVGASDRAWLDPLIEYRWPGYQVRFPASDRRVDEEYLGLSSSRLHEVVTATIRGWSGSELLLDTAATEVGATTVEVADRRVFTADVVVDARGPARSVDASDAGFQKFVGREVELTEPHGLDRPVLMDARVPQKDGYRFFYLLPFGPRTLLVEDTRFSDSSDMDSVQYGLEIERYVDEAGWTVARLVREEQGVLPMPWAGAFEVQTEGPFRAGYRGGWFHPGTGYSFPVAVRVADFVSSVDPGDLFGAAYRTLASEQRRQSRFAHLLNRLLFRWYPQEDRTSIFDRFYRLPPESIRNFYGLRLGRRDMARLLGGRPPRGLSFRYRLSR